jgi:hypothetical protein
MLSVNAFIEFGSVLGSCAAAEAIELLAKTGTAAPRTINASTTRRRDRPPHVAPRVVVAWLRVIVSVLS